MSDMIVRRVLKTRAKALRTNIGVRRLPGGVSRRTTMSVMMVAPVSTPLFVASDRVSKWK